MFRFGNKNKGENKSVDYYGNKVSEPYAVDKKFNSILRIGAILLIGYILFINFDASVTEKEKDLSPLTANIEENCLTAEEIKKEKLALKKQLESSFEEMKNSPKFKKVTEFVNYIEEKKNVETGNVLKTNDGFLIYIPNNVAKNEKELEFDGKDYGFSVTPDLSKNSEKE